MKEYDFVVIGSGIAGISFALKAAKHGSVAVITKRKGTDTNTAWAQGGIACVTSDEDSFELHVRDTLEAGAGLCDEAVVRTIVTEGPERIHELAELGLQFDERIPADLDIDELHLALRIDGPEGLRKSHDLRIVLDRLIKVGHRKRNVI